MYTSNIYLVQLTAPKETLLERVENQSRKDHGKNLSREFLEELLATNPDMLSKYPHLDHVTIDTKEFTPEQSANTIIEFNQIS